MRARSVLTEASRNLATGTTRAALFGLALAVLAGGLAIADARSVMDLRRRAGDFVASGATVQVLVARNTTDAASCEGLSRVTGVRAAGALREADPVVLRAMSANPIPAFAVTPGLVRLLGGDPGARAGAWLPEELARTLRVTAGSTLATTAGTLTVAGTYAHPDDGRDGRLAYAVLLPRLPQGIFDECWVDTRPVSPSAKRTMYAAVKVDGESTEPVNMEQLNAGMGLEFDGAAQFSARATRHALPACAVAGFVLGFAAVRRRRLELAGALHIGMPARAIMTMTLAETAAWALAAFALAAFALVAVVVTGTPVDGRQIYLIDVRGPAAAAVAALAGAACAALTIRERQLFRYFKDRN
ncbi:hypothetical protein SAMN04489712_11535 [Thermomonospora echinospora]|uniref:FtsX-like permease family protein n=1 Tax=Thermomonospora echinospora TaxID=1992 RepID=A0A1H6DB58_9ACTN|nr:hypothetical protein [Thermomonospora echinospora]SEG82500.1 hypothetical protein SAMN04489712_11535 [Thermomonospora echinospora]